MVLALFRLEAVPFAARRHVHGFDKAGVDLRNLLEEITKATPTSRRGTTPGHGPILWTATTLPPLVSENTAVLHKKLVDRLRVPLVGYGSC